MRVVGLDLGTRRVGVAVSDSDGSVATPHSIVVRTGEFEADIAALAAVVNELGAGLVIVGLPLQLDGKLGIAAEKIEAEARALEAAAGITVGLHDERLTTVVATRAQRDAGSRNRRRKGAQRFDDAAAALILQSWLDAHRVEVSP